MITSMPHAARINFANKIGNYAAAIEAVYLSRQRCCASVEHVTARQRHKDSVSLSRQRFQQTIGDLFSTPTIAQRRWRAP